jgi:hypothetical protein
MFIAEEGLIILVRVDDTRITASTQVVRLRFVASWKRELNEDIDVVDMDKNFVEVLHQRRVDDATCELTCRATIDNLRELLGAQPIPTRMSVEYPLGPDAPAVFGAGPTDRNPLIHEHSNGRPPERVHDGLGHRDAPRCAVRRQETRAQYKRRAAYALSVARDPAPPTTLRPPPTSHQSFERRQAPSTRCGSTHRSVTPLGRCWGFPEIGALLVFCSAPPNAAESSEVVELHQTVLAVKSIHFFTFGN